MQIALTRRTDRRHRLTVTRDDGSRESVQLETRSLLLHDLVHLAVETEANLPRAFWGMVACGTSLAGLRLEPDAPEGEQLWIAERLVGPMQAVWNNRLDDARYTALALSATPAVDAGFVDRVRARLRTLTGHWRATQHGKTMRVSWPLV
jgi:hypothetical protein